MSGVSEAGSAVAAVLFEHHRTFLSFLERRVGSRADAEDILQTAYVRSVEKGHSLRDREKVTTWFRRLLQNAATDHHRRRLAERRAVESSNVEKPKFAEPDVELEGAVCQCVTALLATLKDDYRDVLKRVELEDVRVADLAVVEGMTVNATRVRLHRARQALKRQLELICGTWAQHGCPDCTCRVDASFGSDPTKR